MKLSSRIYLDTSVINFLFAEDAPEKQEITIDFFDNFIKTGIYHAFVSDFVITEIEQTQNEMHRNRLKKVLKDYFIDIVELNNIDEIQELASQYIKAEIIPQKKLLDALHVAVCTVCNINFLVSWNYKHLANINRERRINAVNIENNYLNILHIITPLEMIDYEN